MTIIRSYSMLLNKRVSKLRGLPQLPRWCVARGSVEPLCACVPMSQMEVRSLARTFKKASILCLLMRITVLNSKAVGLQGYIINSIILPSSVKNGLQTLPYAAWTLGQFSVYSHRCLRLLAHHRSC